MTYELICLIPSLVCKSPIKPSLSVDTSLKKPSLSINTNPNKTGNEGLDAEAAWRTKAANCEHKDTKDFVPDFGDGSLKTSCDFAPDLETEAGKSTRDKEIYPVKHLAFKSINDVAYLCEDCHSVLCKNCRVEYSSDEQETPTPTKVTFPEFKPTNSSAKAENKETNNKGSLLDEYADTSTEMPDYIGGDD
jgi:hypothetical protein